MSAGGKGDKRRPQAVSEDEAEANWNRIFGRKADQALVEAMRAENLAQATTSNTEQDAKDGQL